MRTRTRKSIALGVALCTLMPAGALLAQGHQHPPHGGHEHGHGDGRHGAPAAAEAATPGFGALVDDFRVVDHTGAPFRLGALRRGAGRSGEIVVLTFWCTTCMSCRGVERRFDELAGRHGQQGVRFLMVDSNHTDSVERIRAFRDQHALQFPVLVDADGAIARWFGAQLTTTTAVIDAGGRLRYYGSFANATAAVEDLLAGREVAKPETPPSG